MTETGKRCGHFDSRLGRKVEPAPLPLDAGIETGNAEAAIIVLASNLHGPDCYWGSGFCDFEDGGVGGERSRRSALVEFDVAIFKQSRGTPEIRKDRCEFVNPSDVRRFGVFIQVQNRNPAFAKRGGGAAERSGAIEYALIAVVE